MQIKEHSIIVVEDAAKEKFIESFRREHGLFDINIFGLNEFKKRYYFDYTKKTIYYVSETRKIIKEVAEIYLENLYYIKDEVDDKKLDFLRTLYDELDAKGLLIHDFQFRKYLEGKEIVLYDLEHVDKFYHAMFDEIAATSTITKIKREIRDTGKKPLYRLADKDEEIAFVAGQISSLLKSGVPIDNIILANISSDYAFTLKRIFADFHIPLELPNENTIFSSLILSKFEELYSDDMSACLKELSSYIKSESDEYVYKKIISVLNEYYWCENYSNVKDYVFSDLAAISNETHTYRHAVRTVDFIAAHFTNEDHVFLMNFNQGSFPVSHKDEDYLSDDLKKLLGYSDSIDLNKKTIERIHLKIRSTTNLTVTYAAHSLSGELYISNAYEESLFVDSTPTLEFSHSDAYNRHLLIAAKDENKKYGTTTATFEKLLKHYQNDPYETFDNAFKGIDPTSLREFLENKLTLSYSSMNSYYKCSFRYYLDCILHLERYEDTFATVVGKIFHEVLSECFTENFDFEKAWKRSVERNSYPFQKMENFYLGLLKEELKFIISQLDTQRSMTALDSALYEQRILVPLDDKDEVVFKGFVDKILYNTRGETKVASIVDYKTGHPELNLDNIIYGLDMQLPIYAYLLKHFEPLKDAEIGGLYLQKILNGTKDPAIKSASLRLQGYSNSNPRILGVVDKNYEDSSLIKSMKMTKGKFYSYAKVLSNEQIEKMISVVEEKIREAAHNIKEATFTIDPKEIDGDNVGCLYCTYKDICYVKNANIKKLKKQKKEDFLGGEENGLD